MSSYKDGNWAARFGALGDEAEGIFATLFPAHHRSGLNRPPLSVSQLSIVDRNTPDFLTTSGYVECMGVGGRSPSLKLKAQKAIALCIWNHQTPTDLFVYDSGTSGARRRWWRAPILDWIDACLLKGEVKTFPDNNLPYWELKPDHFPIEPTSLEPNVQATA